MNIFNISLKIFIYLIMIKQSILKVILLWYYKLYDQKILKSFKNKIYHNQGNSNN